MTTLGDLACDETDAEHSMPPSASRLAVTVPDTIHIEPGAGATLRVLVQNLGEEADLVELTFDGPEWAWLAPRRVRIVAGGATQVRLSAAPRRDTAPSRWPYAVVARSVRDPDAQAVAESELLTTSSAADSAVELEATTVADRRRARFVLSIRNDSETPAPVSVELIADAHLRPEAPASATAPARGTARLELTVTPRRRRLIRRRDHEFSFVVHVGADPPARLAATYRQLPQVPARMLVLLTLFASVALVGLLSG